MSDEVKAHFPSITEDDLELELDSGRSVFLNRVRWARQRLVEAGYVSKEVRGVWCLTPEGHRQAEIELAGKSQSIRDHSVKSAPVFLCSNTTLADLMQEHEQQIHADLLTRLLGVSPDHFERLSSELLRALGFRDVTVTQRSNDGGIDGHGKLRIGIVSVNTSFQCKRYAPTNTVGRPAVQQLRGASQGRFDQAIFMTTSSFSTGAKEESIVRGSIPIVLVDGRRMTDLMIKHEIGVASKPLQLTTINEDFFTPPGDADEE